MKKLITFFISAFIIFSLALPVSAAVTSLSGEGTADNPYQIKTAGDYSYFVKNYRALGNAYFSLEDSITVTAKPVGSSSYPFAGNFDGKNNTITFEGTFTGMFGYVDGATVSNLTVCGENSFEDDCAGGIVRCALNNTKLTKCEYKGSVFNTNDYTGGICSYAENGITIKQCVNHAEINSDSSYVGGILGFATEGSITVEDCTNYGKVSGFSYISGIIGKTEECGFNVDHCINAAEINATKNAAGIMAFTNGECEEEIKVLNCSNRGNITMTDPTRGYCGGIISEGLSDVADFTVINCLNTGKISGSYRVGGIMAYWSSAVGRKITMYNCFNGGVISGTNIGAVFGYWDKRVSDVIHDNYYDSSKCKVTDYLKSLESKNATALSGNDANDKAVTAINNFIDSDKNANKGLLYAAIGNVDKNGKIVTDANSNTSTQVVFANDIPTGGLNEGSVLSEGNLWIIVIVAVIATGLIAALIVFKKKGTKATDK
ncbi:MAG: hypothetical protein MJ080_05245 [Clostridia bacterium]|nr:hypothetical protein [Clostridia bacterium]